jgi:predicted ATPase
MGLSGARGAGAGLSLFPGNAGGDGTGGGNPAAAEAYLGRAFADGVYFINLAPISDPELVLSAIAAPLGVREANDRSLLQGVTDSLRQKHLLLLLDNFEHVLAAAPLIAQLLAAAPRLKALATSRTVLRLRGEHDFPVPPLAWPPKVESGKLRVERSEELAGVGLSTLNSQPSTLNSGAVPGGGAIHRAGGGRQTRLYVDP